MTGKSGVARLTDFPDAESVWLAVPDLNGQPRGKRMPAAKAEKLWSGTVKMPLSSLSLDIFGDDVADSPLVFETGDQDGFLRPTSRGPVSMPWASQGALLLPMSMEHAPGQPFGGDPRDALKAVLLRYAARGWHVQAATELEFFLFHDDTADPVAERLRVGGDILGLRSLEAYDAFLSALYAACATMGLPAETATSESGRGQFEVTLTHGPALKAADDTWLFKMLVKGLARQFGMTATFMAKPFDGDAGNGLHMHFSITDDAGLNIFDDGGEAGTDAMRHAVGGCLATMAEATLVFAPHENSYRRFVPGAHAPMGLSWGYENRTVAVRIPAGPGSARRIEHRVAGGDANPYLLFSAVLGGAFLGIEDGIAPPDPITGNAYALNLAGLAADWGAALDMFEAGARMKRLFPLELIEQFVCQKRQEIRRITDLSDEERRLLYLDGV
ncbi:MAG: glutamine synthetase family protein [Pseudomonadota bacterium]